MPPTWKHDFHKIGKKQVRNKELNELVHFFDVHHESNSSSENQSKNPSSTRSKSQHSNPSSTPSKRKTIQPNDPCPIHHGSHKWNNYFDNKHGPHFHPPSSNHSGTSGGNNNHTCSGHNDNHCQAPAIEESSNNSNNNTNNGTPYEHDNYNFEHVPNTTQLDHEKKESELVPMIIVEGHQSERSFILSKVLFDLGGSCCGIYCSSIPKGCKVICQQEPFSTVTSPLGVCNHYDVVKLSKLVLPKFTLSQWIKDVKFIVFDNHGHSAYDMIIG